jgi:PAS domain S-box-containing protein
VRRNAETFHGLVENHPMGIYVVDADFRLHSASRGARRAFANVPSPLLGRDLAECLRFIWPEPFASEAIARFRHTLATGEPYVATTTEQRRDIDDIEAYDWRLERITLPDGRLGVVCYFYDLTERQRLENALRESESALD